MTTKAVVADRDDNQRRLLRLALGRGGLFDVVADSGDGPEAVELVTQHRADVLVLDADLPRLDGVAVVERVRTACPTCACVFVTSLPPGELQAAGAVGVVPRDTPATKLAAEVRAIAATLEAVDVATHAARAVGDDELAPRTARRFVDEVLAGTGFDNVLDTVELLVTEVVTNAVMHARSEARVVIRLLDDAVRVEVIDTDDSFPARRQPRFDQPGGRGLDLVEKMSRSWGIDMLTVGKRTWFEVAREPEP